MRTPPSPRRRNTTVPPRAPLASTSPPPCRPRRWIETVAVAAVLPKWPRPWRRPRRGQRRWPIKLPNSKESSRRAIFFVINLTGIIHRRRIQQRPPRRRRRLSYVHPLQVRFTLGFLYSLLRCGGVASSRRRRRLQCTRRFVVGMFSRCCRRRCDKWLILFTDLSECSWVEWFFVGLLQTDCFEAAAWSFSEQKFRKSKNFSFLLTLHICVAIGNFLMFCWPCSQTVKRTLKLSSVLSALECHSSVGNVVPAWILLYCTSLRFVMHKNTSFFAGVSS